MPQAAESVDGDGGRRGSLNSKINGKGVVQAAVALPRYQNPYPRPQGSSNIKFLAAASNGRTLDQTQQFMASTYLHVPIDQPTKPQPKRKKPQAHPDLSPSASAEISSYLMDTYGPQSIIQSGPKTSGCQPQLDESASNSYLDTALNYPKPTMQIPLR